MATMQYDENRLRALHAQGLSQRELAKTFGLPKTTMRKRLIALGLTPSPQQGQSTAESTPHVHNSIQDIQEVHIAIQTEMLQDLQELVDWWRTRKTLLQVASEGERKTERITFHVEHRWIEAIRRLADLEHLTYTQIVNQAFRQFFAQRSTKEGSEEAENR